MIYLDNSATTRTFPEAAEAAFQAMTEEFFNPAAAYAFGARMEKRVNEARQVAARPLRAKREEIIFTSGGTESNNAAVFGSIRGWRGPLRIITTAVEHHNKTAVRRMTTHRRPPHSDKRENKQII